MKNNLRKLRLAQGFNQRQLAEACHTPQSLVSDIERGTKQPWPAFITRVGKVLNLNVKEIFPNYVLTPKSEEAYLMINNLALTHNAEEMSESV